MPEYSCYLQLRVESDNGIDNISLFITCMAGKAYILSKENLWHGSYHEEVGKAQLQLQLGWCDYIHGMENESLTKLMMNEVSVPRKKKCVQSTGHLKAMTITAGLDIS